MTALGWIAYGVGAFIAATFLLAWMEGMSPRQFVAALRNKSEEDR